VLLTDALDADDLLDDDDDEDELNHKSVSQLSKDYSNAGDDARFVRYCVHVVYFR